MANETTILAAVVVIGAAVIGALARALYRSQTAREDAAGLVLLQQQVEAMRTQVSQALAGHTQLVGQQLGQLAGQVGDRLREHVELVQRAQANVGERLDATARVIGDVQRGLGELREATARVYEVGRDVAGLHDILRAPKLRGGFGEFLLGDLLAQVLPPAHFTLQHGFKSGERVDAVVRLGPALVPIDAKFPLEDFRRLIAATDDDERARSRRAFGTRFRKHVDDVAAKYILPDEGTFDFALMYVPAEHVYYEAVIRDEARELAAYALERRVIPVSPNSLYAYLQAIVLGLRGLRIEARAQEVMAQLAGLAGDLGRFRDDFRLVGRHLGNAASAFTSADRRLERLGDKLGAVGGEDEVAERPEAALPLLRSRS